MNYDAVRTRFLCLTLLSGRKIISVYLLPMITHSRRVETVALLGSEVALKWSNGHESYFPMSFLRAASPSAENQGEPDLFGNRIGGDARTEFEGVSVVDWVFVGGYALQFYFSDGHQTGLFSFGYLENLEQLLAGGK